MPLDIKPVAGVARNFITEFRDFLLKTNMLALALAVVLGQASTKVVNAIVGDVLGGIIKAINPNANGWDSLNVSFWRITLKFGPLLNALIEFACVALVVFMITKTLIKGAPPPPTKACPACKEGIHPDATRCKWCATEQAAVPPPAPPPEAPKATGAMP